MPDAPLSDDRRAMLADKGRRLFGKYCGLNGRGICAESFACYHIDRGERVVAEDLLAFLEAQPEDAITVRLIGRVRRHLEAARG